MQSMMDSKSRKMVRTTQSLGLTNISWHHRRARNRGQTCLPVGLKIPRLCRTRYPSMHDTSCFALSTRINMITRRYRLVTRINRIPHRPCRIRHQNKYDNSPLPTRYQALQGLTSEASRLSADTTRAGRRRNRSIETWMGFLRQKLKKARFSRA